MHAEPGAYLNILPLNESTLRSESKGKGPVLLQEPKHEGSVNIKI
jgi:hypothetical protein